MNPQLLYAIGRHRFAQSGQTIGWRVAVLAIAQGAHRRLDNMRWGRKVRLPDPQIDQRKALRFERFGLSEDVKSGLGTQARRCNR
jgi:hypothetical protein